MNINAEHRRGEPWIECSVHVRCSVENCEQEANKLCGMDYGGEHSASSFNPTFVLDRGARGARWESSLTADGWQLVKIEGMVSRSKTRELNGWVCPAHAAEVNFALGLDE